MTGTVFLVLFLWTAGSVAVGIAIGKAVAYADQLAERDADHMTDDEIRRKCEAIEDAEVRAWQQRWRV